MSIFRRRRTGDDVPAGAAPQQPPLNTLPPFSGMPSLHPQSPLAPHEEQVPPADAGTGHLHHPSWQSAHQGGAQTEAQIAVPAATVHEVLPVGVGTPMPQTAPVSRSGRNMPVAALMGVLMLGLVVVTAWWHPLAFAIFACIACVIAVLEWRNALAKSDRRIPITPIVLATVGLVIAAWHGGPEGLAVALMAGLAGVVAWRVVDERIENTMADSFAAILTLLWIPFLASFLVLMELSTDGWQRVVIMILAVAGADTGALFSGILFGKHPMAPRVSPKKTWEGFAGGMVLGVAAASVGSYFLFDERWWIGALVGVACVIAGALGDLGESALKRDLQVKDMSSVLPGHGGVLDRIDSILFAAPVAYVTFGLLLGAS